MTPAAATARAVEIDGLRRSIRGEVTDPGDAGYDAPVPEDATAYAGRAARFDVSADTTWVDPSNHDANREWVRRTMALFEPDAMLGAYANENAEGRARRHPPQHVDAMVARLAALRRTSHADDVFHVNHNIAPAGAPEGS